LLRATHPKPARPANIRGKDDGSGTAGALSDECEPENKSYNEIRTRCCTLNEGDVDSFVFGNIPSPKRLVVHKFSIIATKIWRIRAKVITHPNLKFNKELTMKYVFIAAVVAFTPTLGLAHTVGEAGDNVSTGHEHALVAVDKNLSQGRVGFHPNTNNVGKPDE
jgi:hypothetical protein